MDKRNYVREIHRKLGKRQKWKGKMETETDIPDEPRDKINRIKERLEDTREEMEIEALIFVEATKQFTFEWIKREMELPTISSDNGSPPHSFRDDSENSEKLRKLKSDLKELPLTIQYIVETNLNNEDYWIHRSSFLHAGVSQDYLEYKKEKMRRELTSSIRMILGCASEIFGDQKEEPENKIWVKEQGRRKYVCFLRFSEEMTASLNRYLERLEELLILDHEIKEEIERIKGKKI